MERFQIQRIKSQIRESTPEPCLLPQKPGEETHSTKRLLCYAKKLFPIDVLVSIVGRRGTYRIVSEPYIPAGYSYPHFDVEAFGERFCTSVFAAARV